MRAYSSTQPLSNPLSAPLTSRFAAHLASISKSASAPSGDSGHNPNSPICQDISRYLFGTCLACPLPTCKGDSTPKQLHHPLISCRAAA